ncbi:MAG TPA: class I SAM-dependent methyltransferase [Candidatus Thermoplasmatota archaeon]
MPDPLGGRWDAAAAYDRIAAARDRALGAPWPAVGRFLAGLPRGAVVLDVGVGNGRYAALAEAWGLRWLGVDISREQLRIARLALPEGSGLARADARRLPVRGEAADAALAIAVVHHLPARGDRVAVLREVKRTLKPGGPWLASAWAETAGFARAGRPAPGGGSTDVVIPYHEGLPQPVDRFFHLYRGGELTAEAEDAGLAVAGERLEQENRFAEGRR